jgi:hypothetical protein
MQKAAKHASIDVFTYIVETLLNIGSMYNNVAEDRELVAAAAYASNETNLAYLTDYLQRRGHLCANGNVPYIPI